jgi:hypothetical protein
VKSCIQRRQSYKRLAHKIAALMLGCRATMAGIACCSSVVISVLCFSFLAGISIGALNAAIIVGKAQSLECRSIQLHRSVLRSEERRGAYLDQSALSACQDLQTHCPGHDRSMRWPSLSFVIGDFVY